MENKKQKIMNYLELEGKLNQIKSKYDMKINKMREKEKKEAI